MKMKGKQKNSSNKENLNPDDIHVESKKKRQLYSTIKNKIVSFWEKISIGEKIQIVGLVVNIIMLGLFLWSTSESLKRADTSNENTIRSIKLAEKNSKLDLQAYLNIDSIKVTLHGVGNYIVSEVSLINTGKTPAYHIKSQSWQKIGGTGVYDKEWANLIEKAPIIGNNFIGPNRRRWVFPTGGNIMTKDDSIRIYNGWGIYLFGKYYYTDIFRDSSHYTQYCVLYNYKTKTYTDYFRYNDQK